MAPQFQSSGHSLVRRLGLWSCTVLKFFARRACGSVRSPTSACTPLEPEGFLCWPRGWTTGALLEGAPDRRLGRKLCRRPGALDKRPSGAVFERHLESLGRCLVCVCGPVSGLCSLAGRWPLSPPTFDFPSSSPKSESPEPHKLLPIELTHQDAFRSLAIHMRQTRAQSNATRSRAAPGRRSASHSTKRGKAWPLPW